MFSYISGKLSEKGSNYVVIDVGGLGYRIYTSATSLGDTNVLLGEKTKFHTYLYLKEGIMDLYGFSTKEELSMFELLISVSGVGAKAGIAILSTASASKIALSIVTNDVSTIKKAQGVGAKIAQRIVLELKDKVKNEISQSDENDISLDYNVKDGDSRGEAISALVVLGYTNTEARKAVLKVDMSITDVEDIIKDALKKLL